MTSKTCLIMLAFVACSSKAPETPNPKTPKTADKISETPVLTVYSGRSALLVEPLLKRFEKRHGVTIKTRFEKSTEALANRLAVEGKKSPADLFFAQSVGYLSLLGEKGLLRPLPDTLLKRVPEARRGAQGKWVATSGRLRVMVYSPERIKQLPKTLEGLADPRVKGRIGWAPGNASFHTHISALMSHWGREKTVNWLKAMKANQPATYPKNSPQVRAVSSGEIDIGWVNHYYLHKLKAQDPTLKAANASFATAGDAGNLVMLAGAAIPASSTQHALAEKLIQFLLSEEGQSYFATQAYEYPAVKGIPLHPDVKSVDPFLLKVPQAALTNLAGSLALLRELRLQ